MSKAIIKGYGEGEFDPMTVSNNMKDSLTLGIDSYKSRLERRKKDVIDAVLNESWWTAQIALGECITFDGIITELEFQLEVMEDDK